MKSLTRIITGLLIVTVGLSFLLTNINILPFSVAIGDWWPIFVIVGGILILLNDTKNYLWACLVIALGVVFQLNQLDVIDVNPWQLFWPTIIRSPVTPYRRHVLITARACDVTSYAAHDGRCDWPKPNKSTVTARVSSGNCRITSLQASPELPIP